MKPEKVKLESTKDRHDRMASFNKSISFIPITKSLPYYKSVRGQYVHRVRSGIIHLWETGFTHASYQLWCGQVGFISKDRERGKIMAEVPEGCVLCATCEGRAIGSGFYVDPIINNRTVKFLPRG